MSKVITACEAANLIPDGATVAMGGFCGFGSPDELLIGIRERFLETGAPRDLTLVKGVSVGDKAERGGSRIALDGLVRKVICSHVGLEPALAKMIEENRCLAYFIPLGTITELLRAAASNKPGVLTRCGLETFADPRLEGSKANALTQETGEDVVTLLNIMGEDCLYYPAIPVDVCIIRGTYQTPKVDTRAAIFDHDKILLVRERSGRWSMPGGWCDYNLSPADNTVKEAMEEAGLEIVIDRLIAVQDRDRHNKPPYAYKVVKIFYLCHAVRGAFVQNIETTDSRYFSIDDLPDLAEEKCSEEQVKMCFKAYRSKEWNVQFE